MHTNHIYIKIDYHIKYFYIILKMEYEFPNDIIKDVIWNRTKNRAIKDGECLI